MPSQEALDRNDAFNAALDEHYRTVGERSDVANQRDIERIIANQWNANGYGDKIDQGLVNHQESIDSSVQEALSGLSENPTASDVQQAISGIPYLTGDGLFGSEQTYTPDARTVVDYALQNNIDLVSQHGDDQWLIQDIGLRSGNSGQAGQHNQAYVRELQRLGLLPELPSGTDVQYDAETGTYRVKAREQSPGEAIAEFGMTKVLPAIAGGIVTGGASGVLGTGGGAALGAGTGSALQGNSAEEIVTDAIRGGILGSVAPDVGGGGALNEIEQPPALPDLGGVLPKLPGEWNDYQDEQRDDSRPYIGNTPVGDRDGWHWEQKEDGTWRAVPDPEQPVDPVDDKKPEGGGGDEAPSGGDIPRGEVDPEDIWVYNNGVLTNTTTGQIRPGGQGMEDGVEYTGDGDRIGSPEEVTVDPNESEFDYSISDGLKDLLGTLGGLGGGNGLGEGTGDGDGDGDGEGIGDQLAMQQVQQQINKLNNPWDVPMLEFDKSNVQAMGDWVYNPQGMMYR